MYPILRCAIFQLQTIDVDGIKLNLFFDRGCGDIVIKKSAIDKLVGIGRAKQIVSGPLEITGIGDQTSVSDDGFSSVCLPLHNGSNAVLGGRCMSKITAQFPIYDLRAVENDLQSRCGKVCRLEVAKRLPKLPANVVSDTDILVGIKYARYFPKIVFECETGLGIYESVSKFLWFKRYSRGSPHKEFSKIEKKFRTVFGKGIYVRSVFPRVCSGISKLLGDK